MSRCLWYRDKLTGLPESVDVNQQDMRSALAMGCDIFCVRSFAAAAGFKSSRYFVDKVLTSGNSMFHAVPLHNMDRNVVAWATATNSAEWGGKRSRERANQAHGYYEEGRSDVSSGTNADIKREIV